MQWPGDKNLVQVHALGEQNRAQCGKINEDQHTEWQAGAGPGKETAFSSKCDRRSQAV